VREIGLFAENANAMNRLIQQQISFTEVRNSFIGFDPADKDVCTPPSISAGDDDDGDTTFLERAVFQLGVSNDEAEDRGMWSDDELQQWTRMEKCKPIQLPGGSQLARRRQAMRHRCSIDSDDSGSLTSGSPPTLSFSP